MDLPVLISRRKVKRVRLQLGSRGLLVIIPQGFNGNVSEILRRHEAWIKKQAGRMWQLTQQAQQLPKLERTLTQLQELIGQYLLEGSQSLQTQPVAVSYRTMKTRWGSCSNEGKISFNKKLRFLPNELVKYVVFHELVHLKHHNHGVLFWQTLENLIPDCKVHKRQLKLYAILLEQEK